jgi:hypothetical protein
MLFLLLSYGVQNAVRVSLIGPGSGLVVAANVIQIVCPVRNKKQYSDYIQQPQSKNEHLRWQRLLTRQKSS